MFLIGFVLGLLFVTPLVILYVLIVRWCDRFEPEPWWLIACAFFWGAIFATVAGGVTSALAQKVYVSVFQLSPGDPDVEALSATVFAPIFEESAKALGVALIASLALFKMKELDGPLDGAIYGGIVGLGFTLTEDILYVANAFSEGGLGGFAFLLFMRTVLLGLSHCTFTACTGLGFGIAAESRNWAVKIIAPIGGFLGAMAMHAMHNGLPTYFGGGGLVAMLLISWLIDVAYFGLLAALVVRDRRTVVRELANEVGSLIHPLELSLVSSYVALSFRNWGALLSRGFSVFTLRRRKQLAIVELAFIKSKRREGVVDPDLDRREGELRDAIARASRAGIFIGS
jgi:RsiW-degrading membrane proteinase PrsW (M82 family)